jgi:hypothetical protein
MKPILKIYFYPFIVLNVIIFEKIWTYFALKKDLKANRKKTLLVIIVSSSVLSLESWDLEEILEFLSW